MNRYSSKKWLKVALPLVKPQLGIICKALDSVSVTTNKKRVTVYIPESLHDQLAELAKQDKRSVSVLIEILVLEALEARGIQAES